MELYDALIQFRDSVIDPLFVREADDDSVVKIIKVNEKNRGKSLIELRFTEEEFLKIFIDDENDYSNTTSMIAACESRYTENLFVDGYWGQEETKEGYVFHHFNEVNIELLRNILKLVNPPLANFELHNPEKTGRFLYDMFGNIINDIGYYYADYYDETLRKGCLDYVQKKLCKKFDNYGIIERSCREHYITTVDLLIRFWDQTKTPHDESIIDMLKNFVFQNNLEFNEDLYEDYYSYWDNENCDGDGFNRVVNRILEKIHDKITDDMSPEDLENIKKFYGLIEKLNMKVGDWQNFPKEKTFGKRNDKKIFNIQNMEDGKVNVLYKDNKEYYHDVKKMSVPLEDFYNFLYHPELF